MATYDLRGIKIANYVNSSGTVSYTGKQTVGDAMNVDIQVKNAEGRLYAESSLAEYMKAITGGTISIGVKYIPTAAQKVMFGVTEKTRTVSSTTVTSLQAKKISSPTPVGVAFYAPCMVDGVEKFECMFISRAIFGLPAMSYATKGDSIQFKTPTTTGEFMADHSTDKAIIEYATAETEANAQAWVDLVLGGT